MAPQVGLSTDGFQNVVNLYNPPAVPGDFAGANIRANITASGFAYKAAAPGVAVGTIGFANPITGYISQYFQPGCFLGFIHRNNQGLITNFLGISTALVASNTEIAAQDQGDFWGVFPAGATPGQKVYINAQNGALTSAATGNGVGGAITSASLSTAGVLTVATITGTPLAVGQVVAGAGVPPGAYIASLGTGTGGTGTYNLATSDGTPFATVSAEAMTYAGVTESQFVVVDAVSAPTAFTASLAAPAAGQAGGGILTVTAVASGAALNQGDFISATGLPASQLTQILSQLTGTTGGNGTYLTTYQGAAISSTNTFASNFGQLAKISSWTTKGT